MAGLIFCENQIKSKPYYVESLGVNLYSGEELSYYIYNNLMLIDSSFIDERLFTFLESIGYESLSAELQANKDSYDYKNLLLLILREIKYYNEEEISLFMNDMDRITNVGAEKVLKEKADLLFNSNRMYEAIRMYEKILSYRLTTDESLKAQIYKSLGNSHARLFAYGSAIEYFLKAYEISGDIDNLKSIYMINKLSKTDNYPQKLFDEIDKRIMITWDEEYQHAITSAKLDDEVLDVEGILDDINESKRTGVLKYITIWKSEFKKVF